VESRYKGERNFGMLNCGFQVKPSFQGVLPQLAQIPLDYEPPKSILARLGQTPRSA